MLLFHKVLYNVFNLLSNLFPVSLYRRNLVFKKTSELLRVPMSWSRIVLEICQSSSVRASWDSESSKILEIAKEGLVVAVVAVIVTLLSKKLIFFPSSLVWARPSLQLISRLKSAKWEKANLLCTPSQFITSMDMRMMRSQTKLAKNSTRSIYLQWANDRETLLMLTLTCLKVMES